MHTYLLTLGNFYFSAFHFANQQLLPKTYDDCMKYIYNVKTKYIHTLQTHSLQWKQDFPVFTFLPCYHCRILFSLQVILLSLQGYCFHYRDIPDLCLFPVVPVRDCSVHTRKLTFKPRPCKFFLEHWCSTRLLNVWTITMHSGWP